MIISFNDKTAYHCTSYDNSQSVYVKQTTDLTQLKTDQFSVFKSNSLLVIYGDFTLNTY